MLAQLATVKARLGLALYDTEHDLLLTDFIRLVSARFALECDRRFARETGAVFEFPADTLEVRVDLFPIESVAGFELKESESNGWQAAAAPDYLLSPARSVIQMCAPLGMGSALARVTFSGGYVLPGATAQPGQAPLPDELELGCVEQAAYYFQNRNRLGLVSVGGGLAVLQDLNVLPPPSAGATAAGTAWFKFSETDLLPGVKRTLQRYARMEM